MSKILYIKIKYNKWIQKSKYKIQYNCDIKLNIKIIISYKNNEK